MRRKTDAKRRPGYGVPEDGARIPEPAAPAPAVNHDVAHDKRCRGAGRGAEGTKGGPRADARAPRLARDCADTLGRGQP